jgi:putative hemolysin
MLLEFIEYEAYSLIIIAVCLFLSAFFSSAETAITSLGTLKVKHLLEQKGKKVKQLKLWIAKPNRVLTTILVFNNGVNILASSVTTQLVHHYYQDSAISIATGITTFLVLVFGEIVPKSFAKSYAETIASFSMRFIVYIYYFSYPIVVVLTWFADKVIQFFSKGKKISPLITEEELEFFVSEGQRQGVIGGIKKDIISSAFDFDETKVREIITPRTKLVALSETVSLEHAIETIIKTGHSRIPVYKDSLDQITGIVLAKDLLKISNGETQPANKQIKDVMRQALFVPESKSIMEAFKDLKRSHNHLAIVIDEYGGTDGIVTMENILEQIVGDIQDEFDREEAKIIKLDAKTYEVLGSINIEDFMRYFNLYEKDLKEEQEVGNVDTLAGWIIQLVGQMPKVGQTVTIGHLKIEVFKVHKKRIQTVKVSTLIKK